MNRMSTDRRNSARWKALRTKFLHSMAHHPYCDMCKRQVDMTNGSRADGATVDHIIPVISDPSLEYEWDNLRLLCRRCNTARGDGTRVVKAWSQHGNSHMVDWEGWARWDEIDGQWHTVGGVPWSGQESWIVTDAKGLVQSVTHYDDMPAHMQI